MGSSEEFLEIFLLLLQLVGLHLVLMEVYQGALHLADLIVDFLGSFEEVTDVLELVVI